MTVAEAVKHLLDTKVVESFAIRERDLPCTAADDIFACRLYIDQHDPAPDRRWLVNAGGEAFWFTSDDLTATDWVVQGGK